MMNGEMEAPEVLKKMNERYFKVHKRECMINQIVGDIGACEEKEFIDMPCQTCNALPLCAKFDEQGRVRLATRYQWIASVMTGISLFEIDQDILFREVSESSISPHEREE